MNFFGHAAVASWSRPSPPVVLGAMLPDFATMSGARLAIDTADVPAGHAPDIARGIAIHHDTDALFHRLPAVTALMRDLDTLLAERNCARGPRRAVAHIGVELLLDGVLVTHAPYRDAYLAAIAYEEPRITWRDTDDHGRFATLLARLRAHGVPDDLRDPAKITLRLGRMLAHRPLLAPSPADLRAIDDALARFQPRVEVAAETVLRGLGTLSTYATSDL